MNEQLFVPSSPQQAQQVINELEALTLRELGEPGRFATEYPPVLQSSMPGFIVDRYLSAPFEFQMTSNDADGVNPFVALDEQGNFYNPLAGVGFSREFTALHARSFAEVMYSVVRKKNEATEQNELALNVATTFDVDRLSDQSPENQVNQPLRDPEEFRRKMAEDPLAAQREIENILETPSIGDLVLTDDQKKLLEPSAISYQEADLLIGFLHRLYR